MPDAVTRRTAVRQRRITQRPTIEAAPTTTVIAISVGGKWPVTIRAHPSRKSQMKIIVVSQKIRQGSAVHFANSFFWSPAMIGNQSGSVCTSCRNDPGGTLTAPTTYSAATRARHE